MLKGPTPAFILELPTYKLPQASQVARQVFFNTKAFLIKAGTTIFCLSVILWAMTYYPRLPDNVAAQVRAEAYAPFGEKQERSDRYAAGEVSATGQRPLGQGLFTVDGIEATNKAVNSEQLRYSIAGRMGHVLEPVIKPLGYDWKMGIGLVGAFAAREMFVGTMAIVYNAGSEEDVTDLQSAMRADTRPDGKAVWTPLVGVSLLVWFVLAMQCMSTLAIVKRETGGWKWPLFMLAYMNVLAYVVALGVLQIGRIWFA
jgi:ferrous iron transport protein B